MHFENTTRKVMYIYPILGPQLQNECTSKMTIAVADNPRLTLLSKVILHVPWIVSAAFIGTCTVFKITVAATTHNMPIGL